MQYRGIVWFFFLGFWLLFSGSGGVIAQTNGHEPLAPASGQIYTIKVLINFHEVDFPDQEPFLDAERGRIYVPLRFVAETLGADVSWQHDTRMVTVSQKNNVVKMIIDSPDSMVNDSYYSLDSTPRLINGRTVVPVRFISEIMGYKVHWNGCAKTVSILDFPEGENVNSHGIGLGDPENKMLKILGYPARKDTSNYGFDWYIYNQSYCNYMQVGIHEGRVQGFYTNAPGWESSTGIYMGMLKYEVNSLLGRPLHYIEKEDALYVIESRSSKDVYLIDNYYLTLFYDAYDNYRVNGVLCLVREAEEELDGYYGILNAELQESYERQIFDLANCERVRRGMAPFIWDERAATTAKEHCRDMIYRNFFDHTNPDGKEPYCRMEEAGIDLWVAAENIAVGPTNAINVHHRWMNSWAHRINILGDIEKLGVGVEFGGTFHTYFAQNFYTPR